VSLYPLTFHPIFKERVWGGRQLESLYHKQLPPKVPIGESWEISDRPEDISVIANGPLAGKDLHWLMAHHPVELIGKAKAQNGRFPLLIKILDAQDKLSLQVHPPPAKAAQLGGEPKTEMWYIADASPGAELYVGLKKGVTRAEFEQKIQNGHVAECFHRLLPKPGDSMFLPSGRVHAIGAGFVIFEVQQNSDTTYRVFDWNRVGLDGKPRALHVRESLESINFQDFDPSLTRAQFSGPGSEEAQTLVDDPLFKVTAHRLSKGARQSLPEGTMRIIAVLEGSMEIQSAGAISRSAGEFCLVPASIMRAAIQATQDARFLEIQADA
jgi:mannose-6-phosphate isomerase